MRLALDSDPQFRELSGNIVFAGFTAPKVVWVKNNEPEDFAKLAKVLLPKDYLRLLLTGEHVAEMSDAAGTSWLDVAKRDWSDDLLSCMRFDRAIRCPVLLKDRKFRHLSEPLLPKIGVSLRVSSWLVEVATMQPLP